MLTPTKFVAYLLDRIEAAADDKIFITVTADRAIGSMWLVTAGLKAGDRLIVEGTDKAPPGSSVKPVAVKLEH